MMEEAKKPNSEKNQRQEQPRRPRGGKPGEQRVKRVGEGRRNSRDFGRPEGEREERAQGRERRPRNERSRRKNYDRPNKGERRTADLLAGKEADGRERHGVSRGNQHKNRRSLKEREERREDERRVRRVQEDLTEDRSLSEEKAKSGQEEGERQGERILVARDRRYITQAEKKTTVVEDEPGTREKQEESLPAPRAEKKRKTWDKLNTDEMKAENDRLDEEIQMEIEALSQISL